ncbi:hypothetical protein LguiB_000507 [Lonicera macranthoides]
MLTGPARIKLDESAPQSNILITAALGGVGIYTIQLAKLGNMHVTATCGTRNAEFVKSLGADEVLDYKTLEGAALKSENKLVPLLESPKAENLEYLVNLVEEGKLKTVINSKHPLSEAEDAWAKSINEQAT